MPVLSRDIPRLRRPLGRLQGFIVRVRWEGPLALETPSRDVEVQPLEWRYERNAYAVHTDQSIEPVDFIDTGVAYGEIAVGTEAYEPGDAAIGGLKKIEEHFAYPGWLRDVTAYTVEIENRSF